MEFQSKDLEIIHRFKIRNGIDETRLYYYFLFIDNDKMIFIKKSRAWYKLMASSNCGFDYIRRESIFDVIFESKKLEDVRNQFEICCAKVFL